jgi:hypothetical protein
MSTKIPGGGLLGGVEISEPSDEAKSLNVRWLERGSFTVGLSEPQSAVDRYTAELKAAIADGFDAVDGYVETNGWSLFQHPDIPKFTRH